MRVENDITSSRKKGWPTQRPNTGRVCRLQMIGRRCGNPGTGPGTATTMGLPIQTPRSTYIRITRITEICPLQCQVYPGRVSSVHVCVRAQAYAVCRATPLVVFCLNAWRYTHGEDERLCLYPKAVSAEWKLGTRVRLKVRQVERTCRCVFREEGNDNALTRLAPMSSASSSDHGWALMRVCAPPAVPPGRRPCRWHWAPLRHRAQRTMA